MSARPRAGSARRARSNRIAPAAWPVLAAMAAAGCVVVPQTRESYDPDCHIVVREIVLQSTVIGGFGACNGDACAAILVTAGAVAAASLVVSGSIAVVGNAVYWFERQGNCRSTDAPPAAQGG